MDDVQYKYDPFTYEYDQNGVKSRIESWPEEKPQDQTAEERKGNITEAKESDWIRKKVINSLDR